MCGGKYYTEKVRLELQGANYIVATKIDGDACVSAGEKTWEGTYNNPANTYPFSFPVKLWIKDAHGQMTTVDSEAVMVNPYQIDIDSGTYVITFKNSVVPTPTSKAVPDVIVEEPNVVPNWVTNEPKCDDTWNGWYRFKNSNGFFNYLASNVQTADQSVNSATWHPIFPIAGRWRVEMYNLMHHYTIPGLA